MSTLETNRRALLGAMLAAPLVTIPVVSFASTSTYDVKRDAYMAARARFLCFCDLELDEESGAACTTSARAFDTYLAEPAPNAAALVEKIALLREEYDDDPIDTQHFEAIAKDACRLAVRS